MIINQEIVFQVCSNIRNNIDQKISFKNLLSKIRKEFQSYNIDLYIRSNRKHSLSLEEFYVDAYYDYEDELDDEIPIEILIYHNFDNNILWNRKHITDLLIQIYDAVVHEFQHQHQSRRRCHREFWPHSSIVLQYLRDPDEIDAYAISIAIELCRSLGKARTLQNLSKYKRLSKFRIQSNLVSPNLFAFVNVFNQHDELVLRRLLKKVYKRVEKIDIDLIFM